MSAFKTQESQLIETATPIINGSRALKPFMMHILKESTVTIGKEEIGTRSLEDLWVMNQKNGIHRALTDA